MAVIRKFPVGKPPKLRFKPGMFLRHKQTRQIKLIKGESNVLSRRNGPNV